MLLLSPGWATSRQAVWRSLLPRRTRLVGLYPGVAVHPLDPLSENLGRVEMQTRGFLLVEGLRWDLAGKGLP